jgi:hypothetical protein
VEDLAKGNSQTTPHGGGCCVFDGMHVFDFQSGEKGA